MSIATNWTFDVTVTGGPHFAVVNQPPIAMDAYDFVTAKLAAGAANVKVDIQPSGGAGNVVLIAMSSDVYDPTVTYDPGGGPQKLDGPVLLVGAGAVALLGAAPPKTLEFDNPLAKAVNIQVLVGRKV